MEVLGFLKSSLLILLACFFLSNCSDKQEIEPNRTFCGVTINQCGHGCYVSHDRTTQECLNILWDEELVDDCRNFMGEIGICSYE